ncbi:MAG: pseudouridine synthase [Prosthecobacter sp.]|jgi:16S rRNA pseudouridine516 synthase|uniref:pseudouridine synthase n=1 Tax=Prosthecobacter sp. TaxID=1965333 RepID=UPI0019F4EEAA|nr:16S rRNA pseudouridine(516) synthase [Prosthecobacter sp.]MBE2285445.1 pseudouridine synthase [Prosthecobacter sp.]
MKLDRLIARHEAMGRQSAHLAIASGRVRVEGTVVTDSHHPIDRFTCVALDGAVIQQPERALYLMMHKPEGILSATKDATHPTVIDLIDDQDKHTLHIAGRLDRSTSGLVLLTNDGRWSKRLMAAEHKVPKVYLVETLEPIALDAVAAFARGFYFHTEDITTLPAELVILGERQARLTLHEGRYHQVKRMFHRVNNRVTRLHRESIGSLALPADLKAGGWRGLDAAAAWAILAL